MITTYDLVGAEGSTALSNDVNTHTHTRMHTHTHTHTHMHTHARTHIQRTQAGEVAGKRKKRFATTTTLFGVYWYRIVLDEAHNIRNHKTAKSIGVNGLKKGEEDIGTMPPHSQWPHHHPPPPPVHRWAVTGTPVQNQLRDMYGLIQFVELAPFDDIKEWKHSIERKCELDSTNWAVWDCLN